MNLESSYDSNPETSMSLLFRAGTNDQSAWERIIRIYSRLIDYWCFRLGVQGHDIENVRQEVFIRLATSIVRFRKHPNQGSFRGFLRTITRNFVISEYRKSQEMAFGGSSANELIQQVPNPEFDVDENDLSAEKAILYQRVMELIANKFSEKHVQIFIHYVVHQRSPSEIAADLDTTPNVVYQVRSRILNYIRTHFLDFLD